MPQTTSRFQLGDAGVPRILRAFLAAENRRRAARDDGLHLLGWRVEGWRHFTGIDDAESPAGACADVKEASAFFEPQRDERRGGGDGLALRPQGVFDVALLADEKIDQLRDGTPVKFARTRIALFGGRLREGGEAGRVSR